MPKICITMKKTSTFGCRKSTRSEPEKLLCLLQHFHEPPLIHHAMNTHRPVTCDLSSLIRSKDSIFSFIPAVLETFM